VDGSDVILDPLKDDWQLVTIDGVPRVSAIDVLRHCGFRSLAKIEQELAFHESAIAALGAVPTRKTPVRHRPSGLAIEQRMVEVPMLTGEQAMALAVATLTHGGIAVRIGLENAFREHGRA
jgi:hypothetical protein